jgi:hypothetical protein
MCQKDADAGALLAAPGDGRRVGANPCVRPLPSPPKPNGRKELGAVPPLYRDEAAVGAQRAVPRVGVLYSRRN